jgi:hypothetical protein
MLKNIIINGICLIEPCMYGVEIDQCNTNKTKIKIKYGNHHKILNNYSIGNLKNISNWRRNKQKHYEIPITETDIVSRCDDYIGKYDRPYIRSQRNNTFCKQIKTTTEYKKCKKCKSEYMQLTEKPIKLDVTDDKNNDSNICDGFHIVTNKKKNKKI